MRLHSALIDGQITASTLGLNETESSAIYTVTDCILSDNDTEKEVVLQGLFSGEGEFHGIPCEKLRPSLVLTTLINFLR